MRLTEREIALIKNIPKVRTNRKRAAWLALFVNLVLLAGVHYFDYGVDTLGLMIAVFIGLSISGVARQYFSPDTDDKLVDLLLRYVDDDSEALRQVYGERK